MLNELIHINVYPQTYYTEGPIIDRSGNVFFTTLSGGTILKMTGNSITEWSRSDCPNGQALLPNGHHIVCDSRLAALLRYDAEGNRLQKDMDTYCGGERINVPNDVIVDKKGNIYFTDSVRHEGKIGFIDTEGKQKIVMHQLDYPNGLALSNDEKTLFVAESYQNRILAFDLTAADKLTNSRVIAHLPQHPSKKEINNLPDGIKVDEKDNIWVAHYGMGMIHCLSAAGSVCRSIRLPFALTSNLFIKNNKIIVTGGYAEPGPGCIAEIELPNE